jgi:hypothetical protein
LTGNTEKIQGDGMDERQAHEFYADPANQVSAGPAYRRTGRRLSATVPVRFPQALIDAVKRLADRDGVTVSSWIRRVVTREVMRRQPAAVTMASQPVRFEASSPPSPPPATVSGHTPDQLELECIA